MLGHFEQHLERRTQFGVGSRQSRTILALGAEQQTTREVRVVRDHQHIAADASLETFVAQPLPEPLAAAVLDVVGGSRRHRGVPEQDVAVDHLRVWVARPFVAHEGGETAGSAAVVELFGGALDLLPGSCRGFGAALAVFAAEAVALGVPQIEHRAVHEDVGQPGPAPCDSTHDRVISGQSRCRADARLAEQLGVIGDSGEVDGTAQPDRPQRLAVVVVGLDAHCFAAREAVGVARAVARALPHRVEGERSMDVGVAEEGLAQRVVMAARLARLGAGEVGARGQRNQQHECGQRGPPHWYTSISVTCEVRA